MCAIWWSPEATETAEDAEAEQLEEAEQQEAADDEARDEVDSDALGSQSEVTWLALRQSQLTSVPAK